MVFYKMHKCIVCNNNSTNVGNHEIPITFHSIPKNAHRRERWLQCLKIKNCYDWYRVCSDHFSKEDYKPGGKRWLYHAAVPKLKPYEAVDMPFVEKDLSCINEHETEQELESFENENPTVNDNEESRRCTIPTNTDNTLYCPSTSTQKHDSEYDAEQTLESSEITIDNPTITIGPPRRSSRKSKPVTTEDFIMYPNKSSTQNNNLQKGANTDEELQCNEDAPIPEFFSLKPKISVGSGMRCSVQNCPNTQSNTTGISFHGYPIANNNLLQIWIQNCGIQDLVKPNEKFKTNLKVCGYHFEDGMYMTTLKKRLKPDAIPTLFYNNDENDGAQPIYSGNENIHMIDYMSASNSGTESRKEKEPQKIVIMLKEAYEKAFHVKEHTEDVVLEDFDNLKCCCAPNCDNKLITSSDGVLCTTLYTPSSREVANEWSYILDLPLTTKSVLCEKHFNPEEVKTENQNSKNKLLMPNGAMLALPKNALKRQIVNDVNNDSLNKKVKNDLTDDDIQTTMCAEDGFTDMNSSNVIRTDGSDTHPHLTLPKIFTNGSLSISLQPSAKQNMHISELETESANNSAANLDTLLKTKNNDHDNSSQSSFEQMPSTSTSLSFTLNPDVMQNKPTDISRSSSLINAEPAENIKTIPTNSSSYSRIEKLLSIPKTLRNNNSVSISFKPSLPPTAATSPLSSFKQTERDSISTSKLTNIQIASLKSEPDIGYHNLNVIKNLPQFENSESNDVIFNDVQCVHDFSNNIELPNYFWKTVCLKNPNKTIFTQRDYFMKIIKKVFFYNNLVPVIIINNKRYEYNSTIDTKNSLEILLEKIDNIEVCLGYDGYVHEQCIGYFEDSLKETCVKCQELTKDEYLHSMNAILKIKSNRIVQLENQIAEKEVRVNQKRLNINERKRKENIYVRTTIKPPFGLIGSI